MARTHRYATPLTKRMIRVYEGWKPIPPHYVRAKWDARSNPPSRYRRHWRQQTRNCIKQQMLHCMEEDFLLEHRISRVTSLWDWY